jgi:hypothetical protein
MCVEQALPSPAIGEPCHMVGAVGTDSAAWAMVGADIERSAGIGLAPRPGWGAIALVEPSREQRAIGIERDSLKTLTLGIGSDRTRLGEGQAAIIGARIEDLSIEGAVLEDRIGDGHTAILVDSDLRPRSPERATDSRPAPISFPMQRTQFGRLLSGQGSPMRRTGFSPTTLWSARASRSPPGGVGKSP